MSGWVYVGNFQQMTRPQLKAFIRWVALEAPAAAFYYRSALPAILSAGYGLVMSVLLKLK